MNRKLLAILISATFIAAFATPALAAEEAPTELRAQTREARVDLKTKRTAAILEGDTAWVAISWKAKNGDATDFRIVARTETAGATISYPDNTGTHSSLMDNDTLSAGETDFTSLKVSVPYGVRSVKLTIKATWLDNGEKRDKDYKVQVPVAKFKGDDLAQVTSDAGSVATGDPSWLGVEWTGIAPTLNNVRMTVNGPAGVAVTYPAEGSFTSLNYDDTLEDGETDVTRFLVNAAGVAPGAYTFAVVLSYTKNGSAKSVSGTVTFDVTS